METIEAARRSSRASMVRRSSPVRAFARRLSRSTPSTKSKSQAEDITTPAHGNRHELRKILKILNAKDPSTWPPVLMLKALEAGGIYIDGTTTEAEMRRLTEALSKSAQKQWAVEAKMLARAGSKTKDTSVKALFTRASKAHTEDSSRTSSSNECIMTGRRGSELSRDLDALDALVLESQRNLQASKYNLPLPRRPAHLGDSDYRDQLRAVLVPDWAKDTLWSSTVDAVMRCNWQPHVVTPR